MTFLMYLGAGNSVKLSSIFMPKMFHQQERKVPLNREVYVCDSDFFNWVQYIFLETPNCPK